MAFHSSSIELSSETKKRVWPLANFRPIGRRRSFFPWQLGGKPFG